MGNSQNRHRYLKFPEQTLGLKVLGKEKDAEQFSCHKRKRLHLHRLHKHGGANARATNAAEDGYDALVASPCHKRGMRPSIHYTDDR
jgi:hypothetical protein